MAVGFQVIGDAGNVLVSQDYKNMQMVEKGTITAPGSGAASYTAGFTRTGLVAPLMFLAGASLATGYACTRNADGSTYFQIIMPLGATVTFYIFDTAAAANPHGALQVYNAGGEVVFDSGAKALRIAAQVNVPPGAGGFTSLTSGRSYAVAHVVFGLRELYATGFFDLMGGVGDDGGYRQGLFHVRPTSIQGVTNYRNANLLVADVTGY